MIKSLVKRLKNIRMTSEKLYRNLTADQSAWLVLNQPEAARFLKNVEVHSVLHGHRKYVFKRVFLCLERFHGRFIHFDIGVKEKPRNVHLKLIFCHVLS